MSTARKRPDLSDVGDRSARGVRCVATGLISGTSADGVDAAVVDVEGSGGAAALKVLHFETVPYGAELRDLVLRAAHMTVAELTRLHVRLGRVFAAAALHAVEAARLHPSEVDVLGSHGQTVFHAPPARNQPGASLQIGDGCVLAHETGIVTISDFRAADLAAGGEGAPLAPYLDWVLFHRLRGATVALNLGGIANVTYIPGGDRSVAETGEAHPSGEDPPRCGNADHGPDGVLGFDTGPANMVLDALATRLLPGAPAFDREGAAAARGEVDGALLARLLEHPFFHRPPPKSTGRELFGSTYLDEFCTLGRGLAPQDLLATAAALCAYTVSGAVTWFGEQNAPAVARVVASGGGVHNATVMNMLRERLAPIPLEISDRWGIPVDGKEAVLFALLAAESLRGVPASLPGVTGARRSKVLGKTSIP